MKEKKKKTNKTSYRTKEFTTVTYLFFTVFILMMIYYAYFMFFKSEDFINSPYNSLQNLFSEHVIRGDITTSDGTVIATSVFDEEGNELRKYPYDNLFAHAVGFSVNGNSGLENQMNFSLLRSHEFFVDRIVNSLSDVRNQGDNVVTTMNLELQQVAYKALGNADGAIIVMEPSTGRILAMVSKPDFNPNTIEKKWKEINSEESTALLNRATQGQYAPGSTFKIFTTLEFYREMPFEFINYSFDCEGEYTKDGKTIHCSNNTKHGQEDMVASFANSCNASYANIAESLDMDAFMKLLEEDLFNTDLPVSFESTSSKVSISNHDSTSLIMETAIGQGKTYVSPLHLCMIVSAIDNYGLLMQPYLVDKITNAQGVSVKEYYPKKIKKLFTDDECDILEQCMDAVVQDGTATKLKNQKYTAYGKTGTAQISDSSNNTNSWFVGYAKMEGYKDITVAVIIEESNINGKKASTAAKKLFDAYFK